MMIMSGNRLQQLLSTSAGMLAESGAEALSMRNLGAKVGIRPSVIYHYFESKEDLLFKTFQYCTQRLGHSLVQLPTNLRSVSDLLHQRIEFQFDNADLMVASLKYFMANGVKLGEAGVPPQVYHHICEVLERGVQEGVFVIEDVAAEAKAITHTINGFILEYYPDVPVDDDRRKLITQIHGFVLRALT